ncbi:MAG: hypothetical protein KF726_11500, partial [Anaerolineae bacterium]|nr:hypothetical protein [Anaerolineae bacterium]
LVDAEIESVKLHLKQANNLLRLKQRKADALRQAREKVKFIDRFGDDLSALWQLPDDEVNKVLFSVLGQVRLYVRDGRVVRMY